MSAQKSKKGLTYLVFISMLWVIASCSSDSNDPPAPGGQQGGNSSIGGNPSSSSTPVVNPSSDSRSSSSSEVASSSSSIAGNSSSSNGDPMHVTLSCGPVQATVERGGTITEPTVTCSDGSTASDPQWTGRPQQNGGWQVSQTPGSSEYNIKVTATCGSVPGLTADCGIVIVGTGNTSSSSAGSSSSVAGGSSSSVAGSNTPPTAAEREKREIVYVEGGHSKQKLDLTLPSTGNGPFPVVIFIHGGAFMGGTKADVKDTPINNAPSHGYALASLGYRLSNEGGSFPNSVKDLTAAIRFLRANAAKYHLDPNKFALSGCSAGSYYTALLAAISGGGHDFDDAAMGNPGVSSAVQVAACTSALTDIELLDDHQAINTGVRYMFDHETANSPEATYIGSSLVPSAVASNATTKEKLRLANPLTYVTTEHCAGIAPILMIHAQDDNLLPWQQSQILVDKMNQVCGTGKAEIDKPATGGHCAFPSETRIFNYIDNVLKK